MQLRLIAKGININLPPQKKYPHTESNRNQRNRNPPFYPLNYEGKIFGKDSETR